MTDFKRNYCLNYSSAFDTDSINDRLIVVVFHPVLVIAFCRAVLKETGLTGVVTPARAAKKWENLKKTYKVRMHHN